MNTAQNMIKRIRNPKGREGERLSLQPLNFDEAIAGLAQVKPPEPEKKKAKPKAKKPK
jgi:hypothetical protein